MMPYSSTAAAHMSGQILHIGLLKIHAVARRTVHIRRDAYVSTRDQRNDRAIEIIGDLPGGSSVRKHNRRIRLVALQIKRYPHKRADDFSIEGEFHTR
jgi:hypothetical protein